MTKLKIVDKVLIVIMIAILLCAVFVPALNHKKPNIFNEYYQHKCDSYAVQNANLSKGQIVFLGDSITDLYPLDDYYTDLTLATYNRGIGGDTTKGVLNRLKVSAYDLVPSKIVLMIGINDVNGGKDNEYILSNYDKILSQIKANLPGTQVYCMSVLSMGHFEDIDISSTITQIKQLNAGIHTLADKYSYNFVDLFSHTVDDMEYLMADFTEDMLHLNKNGFEVWTSILKPLLM